MEELIGKTIGRYRIEEALGGGSTAFVYKGIHIESGLYVAIKLLHSYLVRNTTIVERFRRESKVIAKLKHPNIVTFYDYYEDGERFFYVMEYLETVTVEDILEKKGLIPLDLALTISLFLCKALEYAHQHRIIHRDIKPSNLFISKDVGVILSDFGLAKPLDSEPITDAGSQMMGTPNFMAPEQVLGHETTWRTDIYQVGVMLYHMITGKLPFEAETPFLRIMRRTEEPIRFNSEQARQFPEAVGAFIEKATQIDPGGRFASAEETRAAIEGLRALVAARQV